MLLVAVETSVRIENGELNSWSLIARTLRALDGAQSLPEYAFATLQASNGCGTVPLPLKGEKWVIYLDDATGKVAQAFPLDTVRKFDPRAASVR